jgi:hypothetical protein
MIRLLKQYWFPASLIALVVLFIPGLVLFALNLFGWEKSANAYLVDHLNLSYHLPIPWWGILLLLLVPPIIVLLYFLKLKRKPLSVPSTFLWKKSIEDLHVNSLFQRLRENVLLLLQVLAVVLIIYGVMAFHLHGQSGSGRHYIIVVDNSASMSATDVEPTRLDWAKKEALKVIDAATDDDFGMVIVFNSSAEILQSYTSNRSLLRQAVKDITQTQRPTRIEEALNLADSLANPVRSTENAAVAPENPQAGKERVYVTPEGIFTEVHLFSDGRFPDLPESALASLNSRVLGNDSPLGNLDIRYHAAGAMKEDTAGKDNRDVFVPTSESRDNVGIVTFNARRDEEEEAKRREALESGKRVEELEPGKLYLIVGLRNYGDEDAYVAVEVFKEVRGEREPVIDQGDQDGGPRKVRVVPKRQESKEKEAGKEELVARAEAGEATVAIKIDDVNNRASAVYYARLIQFQDKTALDAYQRDGSRTRVRKDKFAMDDEAWLVVGVARKSRVLVVSNENDVLNAFFKQPATQDVADVVWLAPNEMSQESYRKPARNGDFDLVIFDGCAPAEEKEMPRSNTFFIGRPPPPWRFPPADGKPDPNFKYYVEKLATPRIKGWDRDSSVLKSLNALYEVVILDAFTIRDLPQRDRLIETDKNATLMYTQGRGPFTDVVLTFTLLEDNKWNTDWPLQPNFPQFMRNVLYALGNITDQASEDRVQPGQVKILRPDMTARRGFVTDPDGKKTLLAHEERDPRTDFIFGKTDRLGVYQVKWEDDTERPFSVNLLDKDESNIEPRPAFQVGSVSVRSGREIGQPREVWKWFALAALLILLLEWYIYNRRVYI